ncbi:hypothetical protein OUZ56_028513 [Daphnia magna]|uniref:Uncharacterized protein n=1 Tax=Daphnia magna TaxID=35525 RepID=A0ABR0B432_9CRUS|nr:hypothetical protein OUZ56_028513 [Daphnia magna]
MEVDSKDSEIEQLSQKLASASADTVSNISSGAENESEEGVQDSWLEGWLFLQNKIFGAMVGENNTWLASATSGSMSHLPVTLAQAENSAMVSRCFALRREQS